MKTIFYSLAVLLLLHTTAHAQFSAKFDNRNVCTCAYFGDTATYLFNPKLTLKHGVGKPDSFTYQLNWLGSKPDLGGNTTNSFAVLYDSTHGFREANSKYQIYFTGYYGEAWSYELEVIDTAGNVARDTIHIQFGGCAGCKATARADTYYVAKNFPITLYPSPCDNDSLVTCDGEFSMVNIFCWSYPTVGLFYENGCCEGKHHSGPSLLYYPKPGYTGTDAITYFEVAGTVPSNNICADTAIKNKIYFIVKDYKHDTTVSAGDSVYFSKFIYYLKHFADSGNGGVMNPWKIIHLWEDSVNGKLIYDQYAINTDSGKLYVNPSHTHTYILTYCEDSATFFGINFHQTQFGPIVPWKTICYSDTFTVHVASTGLNTLSMANIECVLYPSPANEKLNLVFNAARKQSIDMTVTDETGRLIETKQLIVQPGKQTEHLNTSQYANGVYYMQLHTTEGSIVKKFVVSR